MWWDIFVNRTDAYATQTLIKGKWGYLVRYQSVTKELFEAHLAGTITLGLPAIDQDGLSRWCCFDSDHNDGALDRIEKWLVAHHYRCHREGQRPGRAGHLWLFFQEQVPAEALRLFANRVATLAGVKAGTKLGEVEIFPKQDGATWDADSNRYRASSIVRLPLGINRKPEASGARGWFSGVEQNLLSQIFWLGCQASNPATPILDAAPGLRQIAQTKQGSGRHSILSLTAQDAQRVLNALNEISPDQYHEWCQVGMALKAGGFDLDTWEVWSAKSAKFSAGECARKWTTFHGNRTGIGTIFHLASNRS
jgi:Primase C terminal 2 (PriCT-2)